MKIVKSRLIIADPSLVDARGHHFSLTRQVSEGARQLGIEAVWLTHVDFIAPQDLQDVQVCRVFSATMYDRYHPDKKKSIRTDSDRVFLGEFFEGLLQAGANASDHVYFHTGFGEVYRALPEYLSLLSVDHFPYLHICTPYDLDTMPGCGNVAREEIHDTFTRLGSEKMVDRKIFFWAETPQLALQYSETYGFSVRAMPLPPVDGMADENTVDPYGPVTALYLGAARAEKGFVDLPGIVEELYEPYGRTGKLRFVIQCSPQIIGYLPEIKSAIDRLSRFPDAYVRLIKTTISTDEYHRQLTGSDLVMLLYDRNNYRTRGSGIAVEAVSFDKSILTYKDTFCASLITHGGGEAVENVEEAVTAIRQIVTNKREYAHLARLQGDDYRKVNCTQNYVSRLFAQVRRDATPLFYPSSVIGHMTPQLLKMQDCRYRSGNS